MKQASQRSPNFLASVLRIWAAWLIFAFHFNALHNRPADQTDILAIAVFSLISGYFSLQPGSAPREWLVKRFKQVMIPYWPVIAFALIANHIVHYKPTTLFNDLLTFVGLSYFVHNPVYVISWFITLILFLYTSLYLIRLTPKPFGALTFVLLFWGFSSQGTSWTIYFLCFYAGYVFKMFEKFLPTQKSIVPEKINMFFFSLQSYAYSFFLLQGITLILFIKVLHMQGNQFFSVILLSTFGLSVIYKHLIDILIQKIGSLSSKPAPVRIVA